MADPGFAEGIIATVREPLVVLDAGLRVVSVNRSFCRTFRVSHEETYGRLIYELGNRQWDIPRLRELLETILSKNTAFDDFEVDHEFPTIGRRVMLLNARKVYRDGKKTELVLLAIEDITERNSAKAEAKKERKRLYGVLETLPVMICLLTPDYHVAFANGRFRQKFGDSGGRHCYEYCFGFTRPCDFCEAYKPLETGKPHRWECTTPDGTTVIDAYDFPFNDIDGSPMILEMNLDITERKRAEKALHESESRLGYLSSELLIAQERERKRIAGELHDSIGASLGAIKFSIEKTLGQLEPGSPASDSHNGLISLIQQTIEETRRIIADLRPSILDDLGVIPAIGWFCREFQKRYSHLRVDKQIDLSEKEIPESLKTPLFRICQEALNNVAKHSRASLVQLSLMKRANGIDLAIKDNGQGFDAIETGSDREPGKKIGLASMRERAQLSRGSFDLQSTIGKGTMIRVSWPLT